MTDANNPTTTPSSNAASVALWSFFILALGALSWKGLEVGIGIDRWYALIFAAVATGLASLAMHYFARTRNPLYMVGGVLVIAFNAFTSGLGSYELIRATGDPSITAKSQTIAVEEQYYAVKADCQELVAEIEALIAEIETMDNDGDYSNDYLLAGARARLAAKQQRLAAKESSADELAAAVTLSRAAALNTAHTTDTIILQMASSDGTRSESGTVRAFLKCAVPLFFVFELLVAMLGGSIFSGSHSTAVGPNVRESKGDTGSGGSGNAASHYGQNGSHPQHPIALAEPGASNGAGPSDGGAAVGGTGYRLPRPVEVGIGGMNEQAELLNPIASSMSVEDLEELVAAADAEEEKGADISAVTVDLSKNNRVYQLFRTLNRAGGFSTRFSDEDIRDSSFLPCELKRRMICGALRGEDVSDLVPNRKDLVVA